MGRTLRWVTATVLAGGVLLASGCKPMEIEEAPATVGAREKSLDALKQTILTNSKAFYNLKAECEVVIRTPAISRPPQILMSGELAMEKPGKVHLQLFDAGRLYMRLVGDGKDYKVLMPVLSSQYSGAYGEPLRPVSNRVHFMPDDLADVLDIGVTFGRKSQVLRAYPYTFDLLPGHSPSRVLYPAVWAIDSIVAIEEPRPAVRVANSVLIDRRTERIMRLDKFNPDGSLRCRIWILRSGLARGKEGKSATVPDEILIWYPFPLEDTMVRIRFAKQVVNVDIPPEVFDLSKY